MAAVVGVACEDCTGAVELFGEDQTGQFMSHCDGTKREQQGGRPQRARGLGPSVRGTDGEYDVLGSLVAPGANPLGEFCGGKLATAAIEQDGDSGQARGFAGLPGLGKPGEKGGFGGEGFCLDGVVRGDAIDVEAGEGFVACFGSGFP